MTYCNKDYLLLDHTADLGIEISGDDPEDLFKRAGKAFLHLIFGDICIQGTDIMEISLSGDDLPDLMVRWLTEILYILEGEHLVTTDIHIDLLSPTTIKARLGVTPFDPLKHEIQREIKAITYHQIEVTQKDLAWKARVIFDL